MKIVIHSKTRDKKQLIGEYEASCVPSIGDHLWHGAGGPRLKVIDSEFRVNQLINLIPDEKTYDIDLTVEEPKTPSFSGRVKDR